MAKPFLAGLNVLITGGTGSFGRAFLQRALLQGAPRRVAVLSRDESKQAALRETWRGDARLRFLLGDVRDPLRLIDACRGVDLVIHAAAMKRVESCEIDPAEAVATNILGTKYLARACLQQGVARAVMLSTDKAAAPNTLYGATKQVAERLWVGANVYAAGTPTRFAATRYGNVLGSTGSVLTLWRAHAATGGPIMLTDARCTRFVMTLDEAVDLVALAILNMAGGEVFIPKLNRADLLTLADAVAPGCAREETGLRPGEKLHETLITEDEARRTSDMGTYYVLHPSTHTWGPEPAHQGEAVPGDFVYRSDSGSRLTVEQLRRMIA